MRQGEKTMIILHSLAEAPKELLSFLDDCRDFYMCYVIDMRVVQKRKEDTPQIPKSDAALPPRVPSRPSWFISRSRPSRIFFAGVQRGSHLPSSFFPREVAFASADFACEDRVAAEFCGGTREWIAREAARIAAEAGAERGNEAASSEATETSATEESIKHTATGGYLTSFIFCVGCLLILCVWNDLLLCCDWWFWHG